MNEPTHFDLVTIGGGFAGPCTAVLEAGTDASYVMLTVLGGLAEFERDWIRARTRDASGQKAEVSNSRSQAETDRTPEARDDLAARLSTASRCETSPAATTCCTARFPRLTARRANLSYDEATIR
jgi:DNA invertase Pin-like site-specific DNA recombinase